MALTTVDPDGFRRPHIRDAVLPIATEQAQARLDANERDSLAEFLSRLEADFRRIHIRDAALPVAAVDVNEPDSLAEFLSRLEADFRSFSERTRVRSGAFKFFRFFGGRKDRDKAVMVTWRLRKNLSEFIHRLGLLRDRAARVLCEERELLGECTNWSAAVDVACAVSAKAWCGKWDEVYRLWTQAGMLGHAIEAEMKTFPLAELFAEITSETEASLRRLLQRACLFLRALEVLHRDSSSPQEQLEAINLLLDRMHPSSRISFDCVRDVALACNQLEEDAIVLGSVLGCGSYAVVQEVQAFGQRYAMKLFDVEGYFVREAAVHLRLQHPHVVQVLGYVELKRESGFRFGLLMEFMEGGDLDSYIRKSRTSSSSSSPPFPDPVCVDMMLQIARGLQYLHSLRIIHRDVKPGNVLLTRSPGSSSSPSGLLLKLADFGTARAVENPDEVLTSRRGTGFYRAPEVMEDISGDLCAKYTLKADVYSFGMTCYSILTGEVPFETRRGRVGVAELKGRWMRPGARPEIPGFVNPLLGAVVQRCWASRPEKRPGFRELCWDLECIRCCLSSSAAAPHSLTVV